MASRERDLGRKYKGGAEKIRKRKAQEDMKQSLKGSLTKYLKTTNENSNFVDPQGGQEFENADSEINTERIESTLPENKIDVHKEIEDKPTPTEIRTDILDDISLWPILVESQRLYLLEKGPPVKNDVVTYPRDDKNRCFSGIYYFRKLNNGEMVNRDWLVYSKRANKVYCFSCKMFQAGSSQLETEGFDDWQHISERLKQHEVSNSHFKSMQMWKEARVNHDNPSSLEKLTNKVFFEERQKWRDIIERVISIIKYLARHNLALRGSSDKLFTENNGNFLGLIELMAKYDPVLKVHVKNAASKRCVNYLSHEIQNEIISLIGKEIIIKISSLIKQAKYFSVILDCTPDMAHDEQMTCILRYVNFDGDNIEIAETFTGFIAVKDTSGKGLSEILKQHLRNLSIEFNNCRGQGYDNGANMKGYKSGVQAQILRENPRAFFTPCGCHNLNLILSDIASVSPKAMTFFGTVQRLYTFLSASNYRYDIAKKHLKLTPKPLSETRWECRLESVKAIRCQMKELILVLDEIFENPKDPASASEAKSLVNEIKSFEFILSVVIWYEILLAVNRVSKFLQNENMQIDVAIAMLDGLLQTLINFRTTGFEDCLKKAKEICGENDLEAVFTKRRVAKTKRQFDYEGADDPITNQEAKFRIEFFLLIIDRAIQSFKERFCLYEKHNDSFGFLYEMKWVKLSNENLIKCCKDLHTKLKDGEQEDICGTELYEELQSVKNIITADVKSALGFLSFLYKKNLKNVYPNLCIALRILLTLPVTVASAERSFSKLKLIKNYLRTAISQERLVGLALLSVEYNIADEIDFNVVIDNFATAKARKVHF